MMADTQFYVIIGLLVLIIWGGSINNQLAKERK
jgi:hypothetical protein